MTLQTFETFKRILADERGRISLGDLHKQNTSSYRAYLDEYNRIILEPCVEFPASREFWLEKDKQAFDAVMSGIDDAKDGRLSAIDEF